MLHFKPPPPPFPHTHPTPPKQGYTGLIVAGGHGGFQEVMRAPADFTYKASVHVMCDISCVKEALHERAQRGWPRALRDWEENRDEAKRVIGG